MGTRDRFILLLCGLAMLTAILFPPWVSIHPVLPDLHQHLGRAWILNPPHSAGRVMVDPAELLADAITIIAATLIVILCARWYDSGDAIPPGWPGATRPWQPPPEALSTPAADRHLLWWPMTLPRPKIFVLVSTDANQFDPPMTLGHVELKSRLDDKWAWSINGGHGGYCRGLASAMWSVNDAVKRLGANVNLAGEPSATVSIPSANSEFWHHLRFSASFGLFMLRFLMAMVRPTKLRPANTPPLEK